MGVGSSDWFAIPFSLSPVKHTVSLTHPSLTQNQSSHARSARAGGCSYVDSSEVPEYRSLTPDTALERSSPDGKYFAGSDVVGTRAETIQRSAPKCGRVLAQTDGKTWLCLSCEEPHVVRPYPDAYKYNPWTYLEREKARRDARIKAGFCEQCSRLRGPDGNARLCGIHRAKAAARKRLYKERQAHAALNMYGDGVYVAFDAGRRCLANVGDGPHGPPSHSR